MLRKLLAVGLCLPLICLSGCMSLMAHNGGPSGLEEPTAPYAATKVDLELATLVFREEGPFNAAIGGLSALGAIDTPLTFALDTVLAPVDFIATRSSAAKPKSPSCSSDTRD